MVGEELGLKGLDQEGFQSEGEDFSVQCLLDVMMA